MIEGVTQSLDRLSAEVHTEADIFTIYAFCMETGVKHIRFINRLHGVPESNTVFSQSVNDEAQTYIAKLFTPVRNTRKMLITHLWVKYTDTRLQLILKPHQYLTAVVRQTVQHQRNDVMRYVQPQEWKIRRSIRSAISSLPKIRIEKVGPVHFVCHESTTPGESNCLELDEFYDATINRLACEEDVHSMARSACRILYKGEFAGKSIRFTHIMRVVLSQLALRYNIELSAQSTDVSGEIQLLLHSAILNPAREYLFGIIDRIYVSKNKITFENATYYKQVLLAYLQDIFHSGHTCTLREYILESVDKQPRRFLKAHENRLYYLMGLLKQRLEELTSEFYGRNSAAETKSVSSSKKDAQR